MWLIDCNRLNVRVADLRSIKCAIADLQSGVANLKRKLASLSLFNHFGESKL